MMALSFVSWLLVAVVRFLDDTKGVLINGAPLRVWVTLVPPAESIPWLNASNCSKCPADIPCAPQHLLLSIPSD